MGRIDGILLELQPIAFGNDATAKIAVGEQLDSFALQRVIVGQQGLRVGRPHIRKYQSIALLGRIPGLTYFILVVASQWLARLIEAVAFGVELPAMIAATQAVFFDAAVFQRRATMHAVGIHNADTA